MQDTWLISDTHFGHTNAYTFTKDDGTLLRHPYTSAEECDTAMIENWNRVVKPSDKVYHLGDIVINKKHLPTLAKLNGEKILIKGNHDIEKIHRFTEYFRDVRGSHQLAGMLLTHIPIHPQSLARWGCNVHGHLHAKQVMLGDEPDPRYICVSVEQINFTPIHLDEVVKIMADRGLKPNYRNRECS